MEFQQVLRRRRMVRAFTDQPVKPQALQRILANGHRAPSAGFSQGYAFLVLDQPAHTARFWQALSAELWVDDSAQSAPVVIVPLANKHAYLKRYAKPDKAGLGMDTEAGWPVPYWYIDTGFAALLMLLTAVDEGLGAVLSGSAPRRRLPSGPPLASPAPTSRSAPSLSGTLPPRRSPSESAGRGNRSTLSSIAAIGE
jgi:nitroreductase